MKNLGEIMAHKARLAERIASQRGRLADEFDALGPLFSVADRGLAVARTIRAHPEWIAMAACALVLLRPRRSLALASKAFAAWRTWKWARVALANAARLI